VDVSGNGSTASQYYLYNHRGDVVGVTDASGVVKALYEYDAYGNVTTSDNSGGGAGPEEILFTGKDKDDISGLYYFNARWYDPEVGSYISRTPLAPNVEKPYLFCEDNPVRYVDRRGWAPEDILPPLPPGVVSDDTPTVITLPVALPRPPTLPSPMPPLPPDGGSQPSPPPPGDDKGGDEGGDKNGGASPSPPKYPHVPGLGENVRDRGIDIISPPGVPISNLPQAAEAVVGEYHIAVEMRDYRNFTVEAWGDDFADYVPHNRHREIRERKERERNAKRLE
jgi:RHS repeat-associated protein